MNGQRTNAAELSLLPVRGTAVALLAMLLYAVLLSVAPQLHERLHKDAAKLGHECAVTLIAAGKYDHSAPPTVFVAPQPGTYFAKIAALTPVSVPALYLSASLFEHAPPVVS